MSDLRTFTLGARQERLVEETEGLTTPGLRPRDQRHIPSKSRSCPYWRVFLRQWRRGSGEEVVFGREQEAGISLSRCSSGRLVKEVTPSPI